MSAASWCNINGVLCEFSARKEEEYEQNFLCLFGTVFCDALWKRKAQISESV